jgi:ankyrin repeat protein
MTYLFVLSSLGRIPLIEVCEFGCIEIVRYLLDEDPDLDLRESLQVAACSGRLDIVQFFLDYDPDSFREEVCESALVGSHPEPWDLFPTMDCFRTLLSFRVLTSTTFSKLFLFAVQCHNLDAIKLLADHGDIPTALITSIRHPEIFEFLFRFQPVHSDEYLPLAISCGQLKIVQLLIEYEIDLRTKGDAALTYAVWGGQTEIIHCLLDHEARIAPSTRLFVENNDSPEIHQALRM